jgi:hypothetical protein
MKKEKKLPWRPKTDDPKQTITFGIKSSEIELLGGKKAVASMSIENAEKEIKRIKKLKK